jgi:hypothetical protein
VHSHARVAHTGSGQLSYWLGVKSTIPLVAWRVGQPTLFWPRPLRFLFFFFSPDRSPVSNSHYCSAVSHALPYRVCFHTERREMYPLLGALIRRFVTILMRLLESAVVTSIAPEGLSVGLAFAQGASCKYQAKFLFSRVVRLWSCFHHITARKLNVQVEISSRDAPRRIFTASERAVGLVLLFAVAAWPLKSLLCALTSCRPDLDATATSPGPEAATRRSLQPPATARPCEAVRAPQGRTTNTTPGCLTSMLTASAGFAC